MLEYFRRHCTCSVVILTAPLTQASVSVGSCWGNGDVSCLAECLESGARRKLVVDSDELDW
eukprot:3192952-Rhodomonas_salina.2